MKSFVRHSEPDFLKQHAARWNRQWTALKTRNPGAQFNWYTYQGQPVNQLLAPTLESQTQQHCSYCDAFPLRKGDNTIDHFRPKGTPRFYKQAYTWKNLYTACGHCQNVKMEKFSEDLLSPDAADYSFERYFVYNYTSHEIEINTTASPDDQRKATVTLRIFQFNHPAQVISRRHSWERWVLKPKNERYLDDFAFRFLLM
jgi:uncharacterized protein (TIGR02646 family)